MTLLIPGLNEDIAKAFTKRLHKSLNKREDTPSLTQLHTLVAQAVGHADWHAAQAYWKQDNEVDEDEGEAKDTHPNFSHGTDVELTYLLQKFAVLMARAKEGSHLSLEDLSSCISFLAILLNDGNHPVEKELLRQAAYLNQELRKRRGKVYVLGLQQVERLVQRAEVGMTRSFLPGRPVPVLPPLPPGVVDEPVVVDFRPTKEEEDESRRLLWERFYKDRREAKEKQRIEQRPLAEESISKAMAVLETMKSGDAQAWGFLLQEIQPLIELQQNPVNTRLTEAMALIRKELGDKSRDPVLTQSRLSRIENHLLRARSMLMEHFWPDEPRDTFPTARESLFEGAVVVGEWKVLHKSIEQARIFYAAFRSINYEETPAVSELCAWWNATAPEEFRGAGAFVVGSLNGSEVKLLDSEFEKQPPVFADEFAKSSSYAVFTSPKGVPYVVLFMKGKAQNNVTSKGVEVLQANGEFLWDWDVEDADEANQSYYSATCLYELHKLEALNFGLERLDRNRVEHDLEDDDIDDELSDE